MIQNDYYSQELHGPYELISIGALELEEGGTIPDCKLAVVTHGQRHPDAHLVLGYQQDHGAGVYR